MLKNKKITTLEGITIIKKIFNEIKHIKYESKEFIRNSKEIINSGKGDCHEQALVIYDKCINENLNAKRLFFIAYNPKNPPNSPGGETHTLCYVNLGEKIFWIENAWYEMKGIHEFNSLHELKEEIKKSYLKFSKTVKLFPNLYFKQVTNKKTNISLKEYVELIMR
jgi:hypothetical protein